MKISETSYRMLFVFVFLFIFIGGKNEIFAQKTATLWEDKLKSTLKNTKDPEQKLVLACEIAQEMTEYDNEKAFKLIEKYEKEIITQNYKEAHIALFLARGEILRLRGRGSEAIKQQEKALEIAKKLKNDKFINKIKRDIANTLSNLTRYSDAQKILENAHEWYKKNDPYGRDCAILVNYLAINTLRQGRYTQALSYSQEAKKIFENIPDLNNQIKMLNNVALIQKNMGFKQEALEKYLLALQQQSQSRENHRQMVTLLLNLGNLYVSPLDTLNFDTAENSYKKAIKIAITIKDTMQIVAMYEAFAKFHAYKNDITKVTNYVKEGYFFIQQTKNYLEEGYYLIRTADAFLKMSMQNEALKNIEKALESFKKNNAEEAIIQALSKLAMSLSQQKNFKNAQIYALDAWERARKNNNQIMPQLYLNILDNYIGLGEFEKGEEWGIMAEKKMLEDNIINFVQHIYFSLYESNVKRKNYEKALYWHEKYHKTYKANNQQDILKNMQEMQTLYNFKGQEKENDFLKKINELNQKQLKQNNIVIFFMALLLFVVMIVGYFLYKNGKKLKKAMNVIQQNNNEITEQNNEIQTQKEHLDEAMQDLENLNQALNIQNQELQTLNDVKTRIFSMISHDMRNPLGNLKAVLELSQTGALPENEKAFLFKRLTIDVERVYDFLNTLLFWARSQMEGFFLQMIQIHAHTNIEKILHIIENQAQQKSISLKNRASIDILLTTDKDILNVIILNLLTNALKFTKKNGIVSIEVSLKNENVLFTIKDTGIGIPLEHQPKIFGVNKFTTYGTNKEKGSGFGLSLCKDFVQLLGGKIYFESVENQGTTFFVEIPQFPQNNFDEVGLTE